MSDTCPICAGPAVATELHGGVQVLSCDREHCWARPVVQPLAEPNQLTHGYLD